MPLFSYKAVHKDGEIATGQIEAYDMQAAAQQLQANGQVPIRIQPVTNKANNKNQRFLFRRRKAGLRNKDIELFTLELSTLLRAGLPLGQALNTLQRLNETPALQQLSDGLGQAIRRGDSLSDALQTASPLFDRFYLNMVRAGEATGALESALHSLAQFKARNRELRESLISTLIYPAILLVLAMLAVAIMLGFVVPQFTNMFDQAGQTMPLLTRIVTGTGHFIAQFWWLLLGAVFIFISLLQRHWQQAAGREQRDRQLLKLPIVGQLLRKLETARFTRTLATLLQNGVSLLSAMEIAKEVINNQIIAQAIGHASNRVRQGEGLGKPLADSQCLPPLAIQLIKVGEETGQLENMLQQLANIYEYDVQIGLKRLLGLLEPIIIIVIAVIISLVILSMVSLMMASNALIF